MLTYNLCLLISITKNMFRLVRMQTDNMLLLADNDFATKEEVELAKPKFIAKPKEKLTLENALSLNSYILSQEEQNMCLTQKGQSKKIELINTDLTKFY